MPREPSTSERVYQQLRQEIVTGELPDGSSHSIYRVAERLGVSRTPARDAVLRLADAGLLTVERNQGFTVHGLDVDDIRDIFELRLLVEVPLAARAAALRVDDDIRALDEAAATLRLATESGADTFLREDRNLHAVIARIADNSAAALVLNTLRTRTEARGISTFGVRGLADVHAEHLPIIDAIRAGRPDAAAAAMREHLVATGTLLLQQVAARTGAEVPDDWWRRMQ